MWSEKRIAPLHVQIHNYTVAFTFSSGNISEYLQLLRSRYLEPHERIQKSCMYDLQKLQEDIIKVYLVGKPLIKDPSKYLRVCFKFRVLRPENIAMGISEGDLQMLRSHLKKTFKVSRCEQYILHTATAYLSLLHCYIRPI